MTDIQKIAEQNDARSNDRKHYESPELKVFGPVGTLTQAGTMNASENMPGEQNNPAFMA